MLGVSSDKKGQQLFQKQSHVMAVSTRVCPLFIPRWPPHYRPGDPIFKLKLCRSSTLTMLLFSKICRYKFGKKC